MVAETDIVIVNWNSREWLHGCLESIARFGEGVNRVIVVDNGSVDGSAEAKAVGLQHTLLRSGRNLGFAKACNLGARGAGAPYLLFLNPDAALLAGAVEKAIAYMESDAAAGTGICGIQLIGEDGRVQRHTVRFPTPLTIYTHRQLQTRFDHLQSRDVDHVVGAFYLIRRPLFEALGGFDERFFVYLEDLDLSYRARAAGWKCHYLAEAKALHRGGGTSEQVKAHRLFYALRSRILYAFKHFNRPGAWAVLLTTLLIEPFLRLARALFRGSAAEAAQAMRAQRMLIADLPDIRRIAAPPRGAGRPEPDLR